MQYMTLSGWIQFLVFLVALAAITKPMGIYLLRVLDPDKEGGLGLLEKIFGPLEWLVYKVARVDPKKQQNWKQYALSLLMLGMVTTVLSYGLYRIQDILPLQKNMPSLGATVDKDEVINGGGKVPGIIAFIQAVSFSTNTDWQSYEPEQMFTHFSQIVSTRAALLLFLGRGHCRGCRAGARHRPSADAEHRQFLGRSDADHFVPVHSRLPGVRPDQRLAGDAHELQRLHQGHDAGSVGGRLAGAARCSRSCRVRSPPTRRPRCWA